MLSIIDPAPHYVFFFFVRTTTHPQSVSSKVTRNGNGTVVAHAVPAKMIRASNAANVRMGLEWSLRNLACVVTKVENANEK